MMNKLRGDMQADPSNLDKGTGLLFLANSYQPSISTPTGPSAMSLYLFGPVARITPNRTPS